MLAYELARLIYEHYDHPALPAVAGISDRCIIKETEDYIKNSKRTRQELEKIGIAIDFLAYHLRFDSGETIFDEVYNNQKFVDIIVEEVNHGVETQLQSTLPYLRSQEIEGVLFSYIDLEKYTLRFTYPNPGKVIGLIHDQVASKNEGKPVITLGCLAEMIIVRASKPVLPVDKIIKKLKKDIPQSNVSGGGHAYAGAIKFVSAHFTEVLENIKQQVKDLDYMANSPESEKCDL
jgi:RecJ-like exonuclease